jgi:hypothetical protein
MTITCKACGADKPADQFYESNKSKCKECVKAASRANRAENIDYYLAYDRARDNQPHRVAARKAYQETDAFRAAHHAANDRYREAQPERARARAAVNKAILRGKLAPWPVCAVPTCECRPEAHHPDYSRPLDVVWLCDFHHKQAHALVKKAA